MVKQTFLHPKKMTQGQGVSACTPEVKTECKYSEVNLIQFYLGKNTKRASIQVS